MRLWQPRPKIFLSYRRSDAGGHAGRLAARLEKHYGPDHVFQDILDIDAGADFSRALSQALENCDVFLALIGPDWLSAKAADGSRRLDDPTDWVHRELALALESGARVIPVLVGNAKLPEKEALPVSLRPLLRHQARSARPDRFEDDVRHLIRSIGGRGRRLLGLPIGAWVGLALIATAISTALHLAGRVRPMGGDFNVAVAEFTELAGGAARVTGDSAELAETVYGRIVAELQTLNDQGFDFEVRAPAATGPIDGTTRETRAAAAQNLAKEIEADVVVFATLDERELVPEFFVRRSDEHFRDAEELTGQHELGTSLFRSTVGAGSLTDNMRLRNELAARAEALARFVIGLSWYAGGEFEEAQEAFASALATGGWKDEDGREVLHLFLANAAGKLGDLETARREFARALELNPDYARGLLGAAEVLFLQAAGGCREEGIDADGLRRAESRYRQALGARLKPAVSNIEAKAALGLGRVYICLAQGLVEDRWLDAAAELDKVVVEFEAGNPDIRGLAAEAYAGMGLTSLPPEADANAVTQPNPGPALCTARLNYRRARELSLDPARTEVFDRMLSFIEQRLNGLDLSCAAASEAASHGGLDSRPPAS